MIFQMFLLNFELFLFHTRMVLPMVLSMETIIILRLALNAPALNSSEQKSVKLTNELNLEISKNWNESPGTALVGI